MKEEVELRSPDGGPASILCGSRLGIWKSGVYIEDERDGGGVDKGGFFFFSWGVMVGGYDF